MWGGRELLLKKCSVSVGSKAWLLSYSIINNGLGVGDGIAWEREQPAHGLIKPPDAFYRLWHPSAIEEIL